MRKLGLLTVLTLAIMVMFATVVMAAGDIQYDSPTNQKIHGSYSKTTAACASCHSTHQGKAAYLLFEDVSTVCMACHDGTVTTAYDVAQGTHNGVTSSAGLFGAAGATRTSVPGLSKHVVNAGLTTAVSPGGNTSGGKDKNGDWGTELDCIACHDPHASGGNARALNPNVNNIANQQNGVLLVTPDIFTTTDNLTFKASKSGWISGRNKEPKVTVTDTTVVPNVTTVPAVTTYTVDYAAGTITFLAAQPAGTVVKASYFPGIVVKMDIVGRMTAAETVKYQSGMNQFCGACHTDYNNVGKTGPTGTGTGGAYDDLLGEYKQAYRHSIGITRTATTADPLFNDSNSLNASYAGLVFEKSAYKNGVLAATVNCVTCHYAHGTSDAFIETSLTRLLGPVNVFNGNNATGSKILQTYDNTRSSALKRIPNMGTCQACHNKK